MKINEIGRYVIQFSAGELGHYLRKKGMYMFTHDELFVAVEQQGAQSVHRLTGDRLAMQYANVGHLCGTRCIEAERGNLQVNGKAISPEKYLKLWRLAMAKPFALEDALGLGITPVLHIRKCKPSMGKNATENWLRAEHLIESSDEIQTTWRIVLDDFANYDIANSINSTVCCEYGDEFDNSNKVSLIVSRTSGSLFPPSRQMDLCEVTT